LGVSPGVAQAARTAADTAIARKPFATAEDRRKRRFRTGG
jgi:hypothetical protein